MELRDKHIILGISGGVAAYKSCELARRLQDRGAQVQAVLTQGAMHFVTPALLHALTGRPAYHDLWDERFETGMGHIGLARAADALLIAPATAHCIAKLAHGLCDDLLSTLALARSRESCALVVAPAMNVQMWQHPATQRNLRVLREDGAAVLEPAEGPQACGETGPGRLLEPEQIVQEMIALFTSKVLAGRRMLITAGPTFEPIDPVRGVTNLSSGKLGFAIAQAAVEAGASVTLVAGPTAQATPRHARRIDVTTALQMFEAVMAEAGRCDVFVAVAAVADWRPDSPGTEKLKKAAGPPPLIRLVANPDILAQVAGLPSAPFCVGFAAETERVQQHARAKLEAKNIPLIVANRAQEVQGADLAELELIDAHGSTVLPRATKIEQARRLIGAIATRLPASPHRDSRVK